MIFCEFMILWSDKLSWIVLRLGWDLGLCRADDFLLSIQIDVTFYILKGVKTIFSAQNDYM